MASPALRGDQARDICSAIGRTPLVELRSLGHRLGRRVWAKCEQLNPGGSVKDRVALSVVLEAEARGRLRPGDTVVEGTGGNTGVGLALVCAARGYRCHLVMPDSIAREKIDAMQLYGASVQLVPAVPFSNTEHYAHISQRLGQQPGWFCTNQFETDANWRAHFGGTGPEIAAALPAVDGFVCSCGTGGTLSGVSQFLKQRGRTSVWLVDPEGSGLFEAVASTRVEAVGGLDNASNAYRVAEMPGTTFLRRSEGSSITEGIGIDRVTANFRRCVLDGALSATDAEVVRMAYWLLRNDGVFVGPSAALNVVGAVKLARALPEGSNVVTILCDTGAYYRSKLFSRPWLEAKGLLAAADDRPDSLAFIA
jgi:cysteine synthase A